MVRITLVGKFEKHGVKEPKGKLGDKTTRRGWKISTTNWSL